MREEVSTKTNMMNMEEGKDENEDQHDEENKMNIQEGRVRMKKKR